MEKIKQYFPELSPHQLAQLARLPELYKDWNAKINVISRKDIDHLLDKHILHGLALSKVIRLKPGAQILDLGTGGGIPGIPLAIAHPEVQFTLIDGRGKKITVVNAIAEALDLKNVKAKHIRAEDLKQRFDFVICRAVASLDKLVYWSKRLIKNKHQHAIPNGLLTLKGGNVKAEIKSLPRHEYVEVYPLKKYFPEEEYYEEKVIIYVQQG